MPPRDDPRVGTPEDQAWRDRINAGSTPVNDADADSLPAYIGVPAGYYTNETRFDVYGRTGLPTNTVREPRYREGAEYGLYDLVSSPAELEALQSALVRAGLLRPADFVPGALGPSTVDGTFEAYRNLLAFANQAGLDEKEALRRLQTSGFGEAVNARRAGGGLPAQVSNRDELRRVFRAAIINTLGVGWSEQQIDRLVNQYQALEQGQAVSMQEAEDAAAMGQTVGGVIEDLPNAETFATEQARSADPTAARGQDFLGVANTFLSLIGAWSPSSGALPGTER